MQEKGIPDLVGCLKCPACSFARFFALEAKDPGAKPRKDEAAQGVVHRLIAAARGAVTIAKSRTEAVAFFNYVQRSESVCFNTPDLQFAVTPDRVQKARQILVDNKKKMSEAQALAVFEEIGIGMLIGYSDNGQKLVMNLTDLQLISAAAAIASAVEGGVVQIDRSEDVEL